MKKKKVERRARKKPKSSQTRVYGPKYGTAFFIIFFIEFLNVPRDFEEPVIACVWSRSNAENALCLRNDRSLRSLTVCYEI